MSWLVKLLHFPEGYSEVLYNGKKYSLIRRNIKGQQSIKFYAQELGRNDFIPKLLGTAGFQREFKWSNTRHLLKVMVIPLSK